MGLNCLRFASPAEAVWRPEAQRDASTNDKPRMSKSKARKLAKSRPGSLRRESFELPEGRLDPAGARWDALGAPRTL